MNNKIRFILKFERFIAILLNLFAVINILLLFITSIKTEQSLIDLYTNITIFSLILYLILRILRVGFSFVKLRDLFPDILFICIGLFVHDSERVFQFYLLGRQTFILIRKFALGSYKGEFLDKLSDNPAVFVLFSFFLVIFIGSLLLLLPSATVSGEDTSIIGALFTSTSATCVTGLIVYDTGTHFTIFGQLIILFLIQIGGLGIMTISSAFAIMLGQKMTLRNESLIQNVIGESNKIDMISLAKNIVIVTLAFEFLGAVIIFLTFKNTFLFSDKAIYYSIFHSISSFCNAGFSLFHNNFMDFRSNLNINFIITSLIIFGGIGFPVLVDIKKSFFKYFKISRLSLHSKIVLSSTIILLFLGTISFFIAEYNCEMKGFSMPDRIFASYFQSVTTRTAGFNTINNANLSKASVLISCILMYIGASPGSTGGGIKTTALVVIFVSVLAMFRGNKDVNVFKRKVSEESIYKVMALIAASITLISVMIFLLLLIEPFTFEQTVFEAFSAFGTVGLSMGITPFLSNLGKVVIVLLMYFGRVGPLTLIFAISESKKTKFTYIEEKISIG
jgi:trk system potassium uptake protein TrkH